MNTNSTQFVSRFARFFTSGLLIAALCGTARPAAASVNDPPPNDWSFTLYEKSNCEGSEVVGQASASTTLSVSDLRTYSFNDKASSWALCNNTGKTATVTVYLYTDSNYSGTTITGASSVTVKDGFCLVQTSISSNDSVSSFKVTATLT